MNRKFTGFLELDAIGNVSYLEAEDGDETLFPNDIVGHNFFDTLPFKNANELRNKFLAFANGYNSVSSFDFICEYAGQYISVSVLLTRITENSDDKNLKSILLHIKQN